MVKIEVAKKIEPKIYAYSTPDVPKHNGWVKIGYTERENVETRIKEQTHTVGIDAHLEWYGLALYDDTKETFRDTDFHVYLRKSGYEYDENAHNEWFKIDGKKSEEEFNTFKKNKGVFSCDDVIPYNLRKEQEDAIRLTKEYFENTEKGEFLWNAKPRFGKTLSVYDFFKKIDAKKVLIVTNRPAIANSWYEDYVKFMGEPSGFKFVSDTDALKKTKFTITRSQYVDNYLNKGKGCIEFVSLQDLKGSIYFGGKYNKLKEVAELEWDVLVIDEAHEGVDTYKTDVAFDRIKRKFTLHLSGTPFKAIANNKFKSDAIFNWTYADEQKAKEEWDKNSEEENPYEYLPRLNLYTYQMSEIVKDIVEKGVKIGDEVKEYAFDLNEFFSTDDKGNFLYEEAVDKFLDSLVTLNKMPFSTEELRNNLKHTFWLLNRVDSAKALVKKLENHKIFKDYKIILAAGDGKKDEDDGVANDKAYNRVVEAIKKNDKTITVSVGQLTTGITIPEWTGVLMLSNIKSPSLYMQAAFRAQNPCLYQDKEGNCYRKENAYVFDFDPARTLIIFEEFANDLYSNTSSGKGTIEDRKKRVYELLNFFPVIGEDENGEMTELDADKVLSIPRRIKSREVVKRGFMSDFLFANISHIFNAPNEVIDTIEKLEAVSQPRASIEHTSVREIEDKLDENNEVNLSNNYIVGKQSECFGSKVYKSIEDADEVIEDILSVGPQGKKEEIEKVTDEKMIKSVMAAVKETYGKDLKSKDISNIEKEVKEKAKESISKTYANYEIDKNTNKENRKEALKECKTDKEKEEVHKEYDKIDREIDKKYTEEIKETQKKIVDEIQTGVIVQAEKTKIEKEKKDIETMVKDHLRGFSRTIPSFLMAYGDENTTLQNFDMIVDDEVFKEVTGISLDEFRFLRDGRDYDDDETGEYKHFNGHLFDETVFNDAVKEFMYQKDRLSNYFDEDNKEDIFDYIPPQKTNQIYTPKAVVKEMIDMLEKENPGCFEDDTKTFADFYVKSGLYITEIVKRLYRNPKMKEKYPNKIDRLKHIFKYQVYGLAPTEIIYKIALNFILGFDKNKEITKHNFKCVDTVPLVKEGILEEELDKIFGGNLDG